MVDFRTIDSPNGLSTFISTVESMRSLCLLVALVPYFYSSDPTFARIPYTIPVQSPSKNREWDEYRYIQEVSRGGGGGGAFLVHTGRVRRRVNCRMIVRDREENVSKPLVIYPLYTLSPLTVNNNNRVPILSVWMIPFTSECMATWQPESGTHLTKPSV